MLQNILLYSLSAINVDTVVNPPMVTVTEEEVQLQAEIVNTMTFSSLIAIPLACIMILAGIIWMIVAKVRYDKNPVGKLSYKKQIILIVLGVFLLPLIFIIGTLVRYFADVL